ncbi:hypothetical protein D3C78_1319190 [compost metagenome]
MQIVAHALGQPDAPLLAWSLSQQQPDFFLGQRRAQRGPASRRQTQAFQQRLAGGEKGVRLGDGAAHVTAPLRNFVVEGEQQKAVDGAEDAHQQHPRKNTQQTSRSVGCG